MNREFKKSFFTSLLVVLFVVSNLLCFKLTNFLDLTISVNFLTYPFTFFCTLMLVNLGGKKQAYQGILIAALIQIFLTISYTLAVSLGSQSIMPDLSASVNNLFAVDQEKIISSLIAFLISHYVLIYIYDNFKSFKKELYGVVLGLLGSMILNSVIYLVFTLRMYEPILIVNMILSNLIISIIMIIVITFIYYILKEKEEKSVFINNDLDILSNEFIKNDKVIEEVVVKTKKNTKKETVKKKPKRDYRKGNANSNKRYSNKKTVKNSKEKVNKITKE